MDSGGSYAGENGDWRYTVVKDSDTDFYAGREYARDDYEFCVDTNEDGVLELQDIAFDPVNIVYGGNLVVHK